MKTKRFILMLLVMLMSVTGAWAETVSYIDVDGRIKSVNATEITNSYSTLNAGWYVVKGADVQTGCLTCNGAVKLILADGAKLTATGWEDVAGIQVSGSDNSLTIYGQINQSGQLFAYGGFRSAGIGGGLRGTGSNITVNGGNITANSGAEGGAGIGGGFSGAGSNITINGGNVAANGSGAGIGGGSHGGASYITINGGTVTANGSMGAGIGSGDHVEGSYITINGGKVTASGVGAGIGSGRYRKAHDITITGGIIVAAGVGSAIGTGDYMEDKSENIFVDSSLSLYADNNNPPITEISHTSETDIAEVLFGRKYAIIDIHKYAESREDGAAYYTCSFCGRIDPVRQHVHSYSDVWSMDGTHHWHQCTSAVGRCTDPRADEAEHVYDKTSLDDNEAYNCSVCGFLDEEVKSQYDARDYMSMTAVGGDVMIGTVPHDNPTYVLQYSLDRRYWTNYAVANTGSIVTIPDGETCYFRTASLTAQTTVMDVNNGRTPQLKKYWNFTMTGTGTIEAGGNIMSLLDKTCQSLAVGDYCFIGLFEDCTKLTIAPKLPATTLGESCYESMFNGCTQLQEAPRLPATALPIGCYNSMFVGCESLDYVETDFTETIQHLDITYNRLVDTSFSQTTDGWLGGTAAEGNLVVNRRMLGTWTGDIDLPQGWRKAIKIKANEDPDNRGKFYTTYYDSWEFGLTDKFKVYTASIARGEDGDELRLVPIDRNVIPYNTGVIICSNKPDIVLPCNRVTTAFPVDDNALTGSTIDTTAPANCYILSYGQHGLAFYRYAQGKALSAHKAYLVYDRPANAPAFRMVFEEDEEDEEDGISPLPASPEGEVMIYNLSGMRLDKLQKGINIVNGKKIIVK